MSFSFSAVVWILRIAVVINGLFLFALRLTITERLNNAASNVRRILLQHGVASEQITDLETEILLISRALGWWFFAGLILLAVIYGWLDRVLKKALQDSSTLRAEK